MFPSPDRPLEKVAIRNIFCVICDNFFFGYRMFWYCSIIYVRNWFTLLNEHNPLLDFEGTRFVNECSIWTCWSFAAVKASWKFLCCVWILNFQSFIDFTCRIPFVSVVIVFFFFCSLFLLYFVWYMMSILKKKNPPTYRLIGEMEGRVRETNIFLMVA